MVELWIWLLNCRDGSWRDESVLCRGECCIAVECIADDVDACDDLNCPFDPSLALFLYIFSCSISHIVHPVFVTQIPIYSLCITIPLPLELTFFI